MYELVELKAKQYYPPHKHLHSEAKFHIILGEGIIILNGKDIHYKKGDVFLVKKNMGHGFRVKTPTLFLSIQKPPIINKKTGKIDVQYL